jgi:3-phytase
MKSFLYFFSFSYLFLFSCREKPSDIPRGIPYATVHPKVVTDTTRWDTDDPAIWINYKNPAESLVIGTDKNRDGGIYAYNLNGNVVRVCSGIDRPNNVDIAYGFSYRGETIDIAVVTERMKQRIRVFRLPGLEPVDNGDLIVFEGEPERAPMGVAVYKRPRDGALFILVSGKSGPEEGYIGEFRLMENDKGDLEMNFVRQFGKFSGKKEIESIAVDSEQGYVYYSDEGAGVRKYHADPDAADAGKELALFASLGFAGDHEGISIYCLEKGKGYILVSDQQANRFWVYSREGSKDHPHSHKLLKIIGVQTEESDGSEVTSLPLPGFPGGLFVAMSNGKTFHYYDWREIAGKDLKTANHNLKH